MAQKSRFTFHIDEQHRFMVVRPIGEMTGPVMAARVVEAYRSVDTPWRYNRIVDLRRYQGYVAKEDRALIASAWADITKGIEYRARVAMVVRDSFEKLRLPELSEQFPHETICYFLDYHEAVGWVMAADHEGYLANLDGLPASLESADIISVE